MPSSFVPDSKKPNGLKECFDMVNLHCASCFPSRFIFFQECLDPFIIVIGGIDCFQNVLVAINERLVVHLRDEVE